MNASATLKSLTLQAFRGSSKTLKVPFEKGKRLTLIYGENASGKTTICDAIEFLAVDKIGSLEERGIGRGLEKYWHTAGKKAADMAVELETDETVCSGTVQDKKAVVGPEAAKPRIALLRRKMILDLVEAQPANRYHAIKQFIDIAEFEASEEALRQLGKTLNTERAEARTLEGESLTTLQGFFDSAGAPAGLNPVSWAQSKLAAPTKDLDKAVAAISKLRAAFDVLSTIPTRLQERWDAVEGARAAAASADEAQKAALALSHEGEALAVLAAGAAFLHNHPEASECPLCRSDDKIVGLADAVGERLAQLEALQRAGEYWQLRRAALAAAEAGYRQVEVDYQDAVALFAAARGGHDWSADVFLPAGPPPTEVAVLPAWLAAASAADSWPGLEATLRDERSFVAALAAAMERYEANVGRRTELDTLVPKIEAALAICVSERQAFTDGIMSEISTDIGEFYEKVHPGEGLNKIALPLDPARRASIDLKADFSGQQVPPGAYFSQSHLDTLGLCIFLALAVRDRPKETLLVLDDVLGSVDEPHVERLIDMIYDVSAKFRHAIVTTHYRPWREKYRWGWLRPDQPCQFIELRGWDMDEGIRVLSSLPEIDRLKALLGESAPDLQSICGKAGVILEAALDYLTQKYECPVPRRAGAAYTLGDLLPAIGKKLREALKVEIRDGVADANAPSPKTVALGPILEEISRIAQARNAFGAHFKEISFEMYPVDAMGFANQVVQLVEALIHPDHGWPSNDKSGSYWRNSGDSRRLHPLKRPG